jgi:hypothetical protein
MRLTFLFLFLLLCSTQVFATAQYPDKIIFEGKEYALHTNPMEAYFEKFPERKPKSGLISSALWRGYVATFEIEGGEMFVKDVEIQVTKPSSESFKTEWKSVLSSVVPDGQKLMVDWFSGLLVLPYGKVINYVHMGYGSTYENYILIPVKEGKASAERRMNAKQYEAFKTKQFAAFKKTEEYKQIIESMKKEGNFDPKFADDFLRSYITSYTSTFLVD